MYPKMQKIGLMDRMSGAAITKRNRNALAAQDYEEAESQHSARLSKAKRGQARMMAKRRMKERNMLADNGDSEGMM